MYQVRRNWLFLLALALVVALLVSACTDPVPSGNESGSSTDPGTSTDRVESLHPQRLAPVVYEIRRRPLEGGGWESQKGPQFQVEPEDQVEVGHGDVVMELALPEAADEHSVRNALRLTPPQAEVEWSETVDGAKQVRIRWPGVEYEGITPLQGDDLPAQYVLTIPAGANLGPSLVLAEPVAITVRRGPEPLYTITEVDNDAVRVPYYRPRRGYDLTLNQHTFELDFTKAMNAESVRSELEKQLGCLGVTDFEVVNDQTMRYSVMTEPNRSCTIDPDGAVDDTGKTVWFGLPLRFTVVPPVEILHGTVGEGSSGMSKPTNLQTLATIDPGRRVAAVLPDRDIVVALEVGYDDDTGGAASYLVWVYYLDPSSGTVTATDDLGPTLGFVYDVLLEASGKSLLLRKADKILRYNIDDGSISDIFSAPEKHRIFGAALSPDGNRLAVAYAPITDARNRALRLAVVTLDHESNPAIYDDVGELSPENWTYGTSIDLVWLPQTDELAFVTYMKQNNYLNILNLETGKTSSLWETPSLHAAPLRYLAAAHDVLGFETTGGLVRINLESHEETQILPDLTGTVNGLAVGGGVAAAEMDGEVTVVNLETPEESFTTEGGLISYDAGTRELWLYRWK